MGENGNGASAFMEDYTYHLVEGQEYSLGAHMLEVCPSVAAARPRIEVHPLGIGDREDPARLVFEGKEGDAIVVSLIDMGGAPASDLPGYPLRQAHHAHAQPAGGPGHVASRAQPHHRCGVLDHRRRRPPYRPLSYDVTAEQMKDWANMMDIEFVHITKDTTVEGLEQQLFLNDLAWKLK